MEKVKIERFRFKLDDNIELNDNYLNRALYQDVKLLIHLDEKLNVRKSVKIIEPDLSKYNSKEIELYYNSNKLGEFKVVNNNQLEPINFKIDDLFELISDGYKKDKYTCLDKNGKDIWKDFEDEKYLENIKYDDDNFKTVYDKYKDLLEIYYKQGYLILNFTDKAEVKGKVSAMCSYIAIRDKFNEILPKGYVVSRPNVFIRGINTEYDFLIIKKEKEEDYIFDKEDVIALGEIKTSGSFISKDNLNDKEKNFKHYIEGEKNGLDIPLIYIALYESFGSKNTSIHYYEYTLANILSLKNKGFFGIFCATKKDSNKLLVPYNYDLNKILKEVVDWRK